MTELIPNKPRTERAVERVLMVVKKSTVDRAHQPNEPNTSRIRQLLQDEDASVADLLASHDEHNRSLDVARETLTRRGIEFVEQDELPSQAIEGVDLVIAIGGDGIVLGVSHAVRDQTPVLGVNSAPAFSVGYLSGCTSIGLENTLNAFERGQLDPVGVQRLQVKVGQTVVNEPVLNDLLFCADNPAMMSRYVLFWPDGRESQRSSGIWVSTPAGSTAALNSAGGPILPLTAKQFAFLVREPYSRPGTSVRYRSAVLSEQQSIAVESRTLEASVFVDGTHRRYPIAFGETLQVSLHPQPLRLIRAL